MTSFCGMESVSRSHRHTTVCHRASNTDDSSLSLMTMMMQRLLQQAPPQVCMLHRVSVTCMSAAQSKCH